MYPYHAVVDRFGNISDYLRSSEFKTNPKSNIFTPLRKVNSEPLANNYLSLPYELKFEIAKYLNLKDFASFSSINIHNYLSLRSDDLLVSKVLDNEVQERQEIRMLAILEDVKQRALKQIFATPIPMNEFGGAIIPPAALSEGPSKLTFDCQDFGQFRSDLYKVFERLCILATNNSTDAFVRAHICSLTIDINNRMHSKIGNLAAGYAYRFIGIASQVYQLENCEGKQNRLTTLANMIEKMELCPSKLFFAANFNTLSCLNKQNQFEWDKFLESLR